VSLLEDCDGSKRHADPAATPRCPQLITGQLSGSMQWFSGTYLLQQWQPLPHVHALAAELLGAYQAGELQRPLQH